MSKGILEKIALGLSIVFIAVAIWFWHAQVQSALELLEMAG